MRLIHQGLMKGIYYKKRIYLSLVSEALFGIQVQLNLHPCLNQELEFDNAESIFSVPLFFAALF